MTVLAKVGNQILRLTLPAWLVVQLNLSQTEARDVPPNDVPMIFAHSFTTSTGTFFRITLKKNEKNVSLLFVIRF